MEKLLKLKGPTWGHQLYTSFQAKIYQTLQSTVSWNRASSVGFFEEGAMVQSSHEAILGVFSFLFFFLHAWGAYIGVALFHCPSGRHATWLAVQQLLSCVNSWMQESFTQYGAHSQYNMGLLGLSLSSWNKREPSFGWTTRKYGVTARWTSISSAHSQSRVMCTIMCLPNDRPQLHIPFF